jgi:small subunit ribosomal protein S4
MGRYTEPTERLSRREGIELELKGLRRLAGKSGLDRRGPVPPGEHGARRRRQPSTFALQLRAKQVLKRIYGVRERQFRRYVREAQASRDRTGDRIVEMLERRLDNVIFRLGFTPTIPAARQLVSHGHVRVNGLRLDRPSYLTRSGDTISLPEGRVRERPSIVDAIERGPQVKLPSYLAIDPSDKFAGRVIGTPMRHDVPFPVNEAAIVEFYAR